MCGLQRSKAGHTASLCGTSTPHQSTQRFAAHAGYDIILDEHCKPWLLEVNHSPSFTAATPLDCTGKEALLADTLRLVLMLLSQLLAARSAVTHRLHLSFCAGAAEQAIHQDAAWRCERGFGLPKMSVGKAVVSATPSRCSAC